MRDRTQASTMNSSPSSMSEHEKLVVVDTDAGLDDAQAILMALSQPHVKVLGITTVHGNTSVKQVSKNVLRLLNVAKRLDIGVYQGCELSLLGSSGDSSHYHGMDGFGDVKDPDPINTSILHKEHAVSALVRIVQQYKGQVSLVCLGPLTNIAMSLRMDPHFGDNLKDCYIMGGNTEAHGNATATAEFNFHTDPEAAKIVLNEFGCPITLACWELCLRVSFPWEWYKSFSNTPTTKGKFVKTLESKAIEAFYNSGESGGNYSKYITADQIIMAAYIEPEVVCESRSCYVTVETGNGLTRGQMVVDDHHTLGKPDNARIIETLNIDLYSKLLLKALQ